MLAPGGPGILDDDTTSVLTGGGLLGPAGWLATGTMVLVMREYEPELPGPLLAGGLAPGVFSGDSGNDK